MKEKKTNFNILMNNIIKNVHSLRVHYSEGKKESLPSIIPPPPLILFNKSIYRRSCLFVWQSIGAGNHCVTTYWRFVRPDTKSVENSPVLAECQKTSGETRAISGLASRRCVAFRWSSVPSNRSSVEPNETCIRKNESCSNISQTRVVSSRSSVERNEPRVRLYGGVVGENECSVAPMNLVEGHVSSLYKPTVLQIFTTFFFQRGKNMNVMAEMIWQKTSRCRKPNNHILRIERMKNET